MNSGRISASDAVKTARGNQFSKHPSRPDSGRLEPVCQPGTQPSFKLRARESVFTIGSCFARNIEEHLDKKGFDVPCWNFRVPKEELWRGTLQVPGILNKYTPYSMLNEVKFAFGNDDGRDFLVERSAGWIDTQLHTNISVSLDRALERREEIRRLYADAIRKSRVIIITLGLIETWYDSVTGRYLNETPDPHLLREHPGRFFFEVMSVDEARLVVFSLIDELAANGPSDQSILLTVSPIPLSRTFTNDDVIVANMYSKSLLRVVAEEARRKYDHVDYFASYESVMLSDRGFAWQDDLIHASRKIIAANVDRMLVSYT